MRGVLQHHEGTTPRLEKRVTWSIVNEDKQEFRLSAVVIFEIIETHSQWTLVATSNVYEAARSEMLFRTTVLKVVTQDRASMSPSCVFRSRFRIHDVHNTSAPSVNCGEKLYQLRTKELVMNAWVDMMRQRDQNKRRILMEKCA